MIKVTLTDSEIMFLRDLLFAYDDNSDSLSEVYLELIEKIDYDYEESEDK